MKIFLSALENGSTCYNSKKSLTQFLLENNIKFKYNLMSYYYIKNKIELAELIRNNSKEIIIAICDTPFLYLSKKLK